MVRIIAPSRLVEAHSHIKELQRATASLAALSVAVGPIKDILIGAARRLQVDVPAIGRSPSPPNIAVLRLNPRSGASATGDPGVLMGYPTGIEGILARVGIPTVRSACFLKMYFGISLRKYYRLFLAPLDSSRRERKAQVANSRQLRRKFGLSPVLSVTARKPMTDWRRGWDSNPRDPFEV